MAAWSCPSCGQYVSTGSSICHRCHPAPQPANGASSNSDAERLERYLREVRPQQMWIDRQALNRQRPSPRAAWGNDRSVANDIVGGANPSTLPPSYPYPTAINDQDMYATTYSEPARQGPSHEAQQIPPYGQQQVSQYVPQQVPTNIPQQSQGQWPAGNQNGAIPRTTQDMQVERRDTEDAGRTESSATAAHVRATGRWRRGHRGSYRQ